MNQRDRQRADHLERLLIRFASATRPLPGISNPTRRSVLVAQMIDSMRRVEFVSIVKARPLSPHRCNPQSSLFDPVRAAAYQANAGNIEEAFWLVFLFVHFGKHRRTGWQLARNIYGRLSSAPPWTWVRVNSAPHAFRAWLETNMATLSTPSLAGQFGNHRKYETLRTDTPNGTHAVVESYIKWVAPPRTHRTLFTIALQESGGDPRRAFDSLYWSMNVRRFGRTAKFDYLTMVGKLGLATIEPGTAYLEGATGPLRGARLLFGGRPDSKLSTASLEKHLQELGAHLRLGMQILEDSLCNWQKHPSIYRRFLG